MATSPTKRALAYCKAQGWTAQVVERWNPWAKVRQDLFGFIDLVVLKPGIGIVGVQVTSDAHVAERVNKIRTTCKDTANEWLRANGVIEVWGWAKRGARGKRKVWTLRTLPVKAAYREDLA